MCSTADLDFNNFIDAATSFDEVISKRTKLYDVKKLIRSFIKTE